MCRFVDDGTLRLWRTRADVTTGETWAVEKVPLQKKGRVLLPAGHKFVSAVSPIR